MTAAQIQATFAPQEKFLDGAARLGERYANAAPPGRITHVADAVTQTIVDGLEAGVETGDEFAALSPFPGLALVVARMVVGHPDRTTDAVVIAAFAWLVNQYAAHLRAEEAGLEAASASASMGAPMGTA